jgi:flagellar hook assembly protein FlgD
MWDGRDEEGDEIANGYYLYQVQVRGDGVERSAIEKLVKLK